MGKVAGRYLLGAGCGLALLIVVGSLFFRSIFPSQPPVVAPAAVARSPLPNLPLEKPTGGYIGSAACQICHPNQHGSWHESYHRTMTQVATEESVLGDFNDVRLSGKDLDVRLFKDEGRFKAEMNLGHSPAKHVYTVVMTTGSHNRQAYWMADPHDRQLVLLPYMYLRTEQRWVPRPSAYITKNGQADSSELAAFRAEKGRWSHVCIRCHTTHGQANPVDEGGSALATPRVAEFGIACEACHGPGAAHVQAEREPVAGNEAIASIVNPAKLPHDRAAQVCGQCHAVLYPRSETVGFVWQMKGSTFRPGDDLFADPTYYVMRGRLDLMPERPAHIPDPADAETGSFWPDGMIRVTGREFCGLIESPCYQRGSMSCLSCHEMHQQKGDTRTPAEWAAGQLKPGMDGNRACVQCHDKFEDAAVAAQHTHHNADSSGSRCYNCHMPHTTYGLLKATRSHMVNSPRVLDSVQAGRPNACNLCHQDKTLAWTAETLAQWYKHAIPKLSADDEKIASSVLWALRGDAAQRALTAWSYGWADAHVASGNNWQAPFLGQLLDDRYNAVRFIAHRSLKRLPGFGDFEYDFMSAPATRAAAVVNARNLWQQTQDGQKRPFATQTLIDHAGRNLDADFHRLLRQRDDRPVEIAE
jgi:hypothetical protein